MSNNGFPIMQLSSNIIRFRKERGLTQEQLADLLNVSVSAVSKWEIGNNRPDLELLPELAEVFQVSIDALLGYEKSYKNLDTKTSAIKKLLEKEQYHEAMDEIVTLLKRYPNDTNLNKMLADAYYSICFSVCERTSIKEYAEKAIHYYEKSIELYDGSHISEYTKENLYCNIATLYALDEIGRYDEAIQILEQYNGSGQYNHMIAHYLFLAGRKEEAKNKILKHCVAQQIFVFNDLSILADMYWRDKDYETALVFLETEVKSYELFMSDKGNYANRAYAGKACIISEIYEKLGDMPNMEKWRLEAEKHAKIYNKNPSMLISDMKYCHGLDGRMIDNYAKLLEQFS